MERFYTTILWLVNKLRSEDMILEGQDMIHKYGVIVSMVVFKDRLFVACQSAVFELIDEKLHPIEFVSNEENN